MATDMKTGNYIAYHRNSLFAAENKTVFVRSRRVVEFSLGPLRGASGVKRLIDSAGSAATRACKRTLWLLPIIDFPDCA